MVSLAVIALVIITLHEAKRMIISQDFVLGLFLCGIVGGFIGGRAVHLIDHWSYYVAHPADIFGFAGLALYGAIIGAVLAVWIFMKIQRKPFLSLDGVAEAVAVGAPLAQALGRLGCTLNGCCFGKLSPYNSFPGAVIYTTRDTIPPQYWGVPLYPTQIYFMIWNFIVFLIIWFLRGRIKPRGCLFFVYLCLYAIGDFSLRFLRYSDTSYLWGLQQGQIISLIVLVVALSLLIIRMYRFRRKPIAQGELIDQMEQNRGY